MKKEPIDIISDIALDIIEKNIISIFPFLGLGKDVSKIMDQIATKNCDELLLHAKKLFTNIQILSIEGERDGIYCSEIQMYKAQEEQADLILSIDPIDGTNPGSRGGTRCLSVIALSDNKEKRHYKTISDCLSCFCVGSQEDESFLNHLSINNNTIGLHGFKEEFLTKSISTLNRLETKELFANLLNIGVEKFDKTYNFNIGERTLFRPNLSYKKILYVGDTTVSLPFETENYIGRVGASEARIEAILWKYWRGLIVSGSKMKQYEGGAVQYLVDRINFANNQNTSFKINDFFHEDEINEMKNYGWSIEEISKIINKEEFAPQYHTIYIASITGTSDKYLKYNYQDTLGPCNYNAEDDEIEYEIWVLKNGTAKKEKRTCKVEKIGSEGINEYILKWYTMHSWTDVLQSIKWENDIPYRKELETLVTLEKRGLLFGKIKKYK